MKLIKVILFNFIFLSLYGCGSNSENVVPTPPPSETEYNLTIFFVNDQHGRINNFAKVKAIVDQAKAKGNTLLVCAGDIFAGNPIVDQFERQGFPMIDLMNQTGFDVSTLGNHEFDFGTEVLAERISDSQFPWILANVNAGNSVINQPNPFVTLSVGDFRVIFLGLIETNGKDDLIPSTHPLRVADLTFQPHETMVGNFENLKAQENADVLVGLTHLGSNDDRNLARNHSFFDVIIGGHSHETINEVINDTPVLQAGANLRLLGKLELAIENQTVVNYTVEMINLDNVTEVDEALETSIAEYNNAPFFAEVLGQSAFNHQAADVGCFFTTALREYMNVDFTIQNLGGVRAGIGQGDITRLEIYTMDPFNNQSVSFTKTVGEYEDFFCQTGARFYFNGINIDISGGNFQIVDDAGNPLPDNTTLTMGVNDFIPAVYDEFFDFEDATIQEYTTAEAIIGYLQTINANIDFEGCSQVLQCN